MTTLIPVDSTWILFAILVVIALNYLISKFVIFRQRKPEALEEYNDG